MAVAGVALISPIMPSVRNLYGLNDFQVSALVWAYMAPGVILAPLIGYTADRWGRRRILVGSLILFGLAGGSGAWADSFRTLLVLRTTQGVGGVSLPLMARTLIGDFYEGERASYMGYHDACLSAGGAFFPVVGGLLGGMAWWLPFIIYFLAVPIGCSAVYVLPEENFQEREGEPTYVSRLWNSLDWGTFGYFLGCIFLVFVLKYGFMYTALPFIVSDDYAAGSGWVGLAVGTMGTTVALVSASQGWIKQWLTTGTIVPLGFFCYGSGLFWGTVMVNPWMLLSGIVLAGVGHGLLLPTINTAIIRLVNKRLRASVMSIRKIFVRGGQTIGSPLLAWLGQLWGMRSVVVWTGVVVGLFSLGIIGRMLYPSNSEAS